MKHHATSKVRRAGQHFAVAATVLGALASPPALFGQLVTEVIDLRTGWNAVWVNLELEPNQVGAILENQNPPFNWEAVWTFEPSRALPGTTTGQPAGRWFFYDRFAPGPVNTLRTLHGHRGYFIKMNSPGRLRLTGRPLIRTSQFSSRAFNLFGAMTHSPAGPLSFEEYFSHPTASGKIRFAGTPLKHDIFSLVGGAFVRKSLADPIASNAAYWVNVVQNFDYPGPINVASSANGISFGQSATRGTLSIEVPASSTNRTISLQARPCAVLSAAGDCSGDLEVDWLQYRKPVPTQDGLPDWGVLADGYSVPVPAGTTRIEVELRPQRTALGSLAAARRAVAGGGTPDAQTFPLVIDVTDDAGSRVVVASDVTVVPIYGRWIGRVVLDRVSAHHSIDDVPLEDAEASPLGMTLILELPEPPALPAMAANRILHSVSIETHRDGRPLLRRFNSIVFDRDVNLAETVPLNALGGTGKLEGTVVIPAEDPLNPYRHRCNPEHRRGYPISRVVTIELQGQDVRLSDQLAGLDGTFGPHRLSGTYTEVISGVTVDPITVRGTLRLDRLLGNPVATRAHQE